MNIFCEKSQETYVGEGKKGARACGMLGRAAHRRHLGLVEGEVHTLRNERVLAQDCASLLFLQVLTRPSAPHSHLGRHVTFKS